MCIDNHMIARVFQQVVPKMLFERRLGLLYSRKTNLLSCKSTNRGFRLSFRYLTLYLRRVKLGTATITRHITRWRRREIQN